MTPRDWVEILAAWGLVVCSALAFPYIRSLLARAVHQAGQLLLRVLRPRVRRWCLSLFALWCVVVVVKWASLLTDTVRAAELAGAVGNTILPLLALLYDWMGLGNMYLEVRENGIVLRAEFWPWEKVRSYTWLDVAPTLRLRLVGYGIADYRIAASQKDAFDRLLHDRVPGAEKIDQTLPSPGAGSCV